MGLSTMRVLSLLALLIGAVAGQPFFSAGREYEFNYQGRLLSGIPELDESHFAGLEIHSTVIIQAKQDNIYKLALKNVKFSKFNERLSGPEPENWRMVRTPETEQVPAEYQTVLEYPVEFTMVNGEVRTIEVSKHEPEWSLNFKKSLVSLLKVQPPSESKDLSQNQVRGGEVSLSEIWKVYEQGVDGKCENIYQVVELPEYTLGEMTFGEVKTEDCEGRKVFEITKTRDVTKCSKRTAFRLSQPGRMKCLDGNCDSMWQRSSMTRYIGCGSSPDNMQLQIILNEGELQQNLMAYNTENVVTGTEQMMKMVEMRTTLSSLPDITSPTSINNLYYEYPQVASRHGSIQQQLQQPASQMRTVPMIHESILVKLSPRTLQSKIVEKISDLVRDLKEVEHFGKKHTSAHVLSISHVIAFFNKQEIKSLYDQVKGMSMDEEDKETARQLLVETIGATGTNPCILFLKEMIESEEFSPLRTGSIIATLPHYIKTPTIEILDELFELIKSTVVTRSEILQTNAELAFTTILNKACIAPTRVTRFPVFVFGEFCNSQTSELTTKFIPYFVQKLHSAATTKEREFSILALGSIGHESIIPVLLPYVEGRSQKTSPAEQRMAIFSLETVTVQHRNTLLPIYSALANNAAEERSVRIAALSMMLYMNPPMVELQKLATSTWYEQDGEFHKFVFSTLKSLKEMDMSSLPEYETLYDLCNMAQIVFHLAKPVPGFFSSTLNVFTAEWLKELEVGYQMHGTFDIQGKDKYMYGKLQYFLQKLTFTPIEFATATMGTETLVEKINEIFSGEIKSLDKIHPEWRQTISSIDLKLKENDPFHAMAWIRMFDDVQVAANLDVSVIEPWLRTVKRTLSKPSDWKKMICGKTPINFVKVHNVAPTEILIASDMGLPMIVEYNMPVVMALKGEINVDCSLNIPKVSFEVSKKASGSSVGSVGTICPFTKNIVAVGINEEFSFNYPTNIAVEMEQGKLKVVFAANEQVGHNTENIDLWSYSIKPFAVSKPVIFLDVTPMIASEHAKIIRSKSNRKNEVYNFGQTLGFDLKWALETETDIRDMKSTIDQFALYEYSPLNVVMFSWTSTAMRRDGRPSCRFTEVAVVYNPRQSSTKKVEIEFGASLAYKSLNEPLQAIQLQNQQIHSQDIHSSDWQHQKIRQHIEKLRIEHGFGVFASTTVNFEGSERKSYTWHMTACHGGSEVQQKWSLHLEDTKEMNICVDGSLQLPLIPVRDSGSFRSENMRFSYENNVGFGKTCEEHKIKISGFTASSQSKKEKIETSRNVRKCEEATKKVDEIRRHLRNTNVESTETRRLERDLVKSVEEKNIYCHAELRELSSLDHVQFRVQYTPMPEYVRKYIRILETGVKGGLIPFMTKIEQGNRRSNEVEVELKFNPHLNTVSMILTTEYETIKYNNIRLPEELENVLPLVASEEIQSQISKVIIGESMSAKCTVGEDFVRSFDDRTYRYVLDDCYHVLSADCSKKSSHAVLGKVVGGKKHLMIFVENSKVTLEPSSRWSESSKEYSVEIDGRPLSLEKGATKEMWSRDGQISYRIHISADGVLILDTPENRIVYDGKIVELEHMIHHQEPECGLCGDKNGDKKIDVKTSQQCAATTIQQAALSYRIQKSCSSPSRRQVQLKHQQQVCQDQLKQQQLESKASVSKTIRSHLKMCGRHMHSIVQQDNRTCISQVPVLECSGGCSSKTLVSKLVPYTCLPLGNKRIVKVYEEKVRRGEILPELRSMNKSFSANVEVPVSCSHPAL